MHKRKKIDPHWQATVDAYRSGVMSVIASINHGEVDALELEKLNNFAQFSLALMQISGPEQWARAKLNAELMSYLKK